MNEKLQKGLVILTEEWKKTKTWISELYQYDKKETTEEALIKLKQTLINGQKNTCYTFHTQGKEICIKSRYGEAKIVYDNGMLSISVGEDFRTNIRTLHEKIEEVQKLIKSQNGKEINNDFQKPTNNQKEEAINHDIATHEEKNNFNDNQSKEIAQIEMKEANETQFIADSMLDEIANFAEASF